MGTESIIMKGRLFGDPYSAVNLWEFRRELRLIKRLIKIAEKYIAEKTTHSSETFEGVCFYIARSIVAYAKSAFDNMVLGHFDTTEMLIRKIVENRVVFELIFNDEECTLWKYYLAHSHHKSLKSVDIGDKKRKDFEELCTRLEIDSEFINRRGDKKPYIEQPYGWTYGIKTIKPVNRFKFKGLCDAVEGQQQNYYDFQWMSRAVHGTSYFEKITNYSGDERIMSLFSSIYINIYLLVIMYCSDTWGHEFEIITEELETIFYRFIEVYDKIYEQP